MKKAILKTTMFVTLLPVASVFAAPNNVGCGVGSMIWEGQSGVAQQVVAATTNGTMGNQTFGITFGTLGCSKNGVVGLPVPHKISQFTNDNLDRLAHDMAIGSGETLNALAALMEIETQDQAAFFNVTKTHFGDIFSNENVTANDVLLSLHNVLVADPLLNRYSFS